MSRFVSCMQWMHAGVAWPAVWWVRGNTWCATQWEKLRKRVVQTAPDDSNTMGW